MTQAVNLELNSVYPLSQWKRAGVRGSELTVIYPLLTRNAAHSHLSPWAR